MTTGQLMEVLRSLPSDTELFNITHEEYTTKPKYYQIKKAIVQLNDTGNYMVILVDERKTG